MSGAFGTKQGWAEWVQERDESQKDPYGWLSLVELVWLDEMPKKLANFPGLWSADGNTVTAVFKKGQPKVYRDGERVKGEFQVDVVPGGESDRSLRDETGREIEIAYRFDGPCVRVRDPHAKRLEEYEGLDRYDFDPQWVLLGRLVPYEAVREIEVPSAIDGHMHKLNTWARADLALPENKETLSLVVTGEGPEDSSVFFYDETNGDTTPGWRAAHAAIDGETVVVDFNRATIFPAHMSPYGTCPQAPVENRIARRVEAGEKTFKGRETE